MVIYFVPEFLLFVMLLMSNKLNKRTTNKLFAIICCLWAVIFGLRSSIVGNDTNDYVDFFYSNGTSIYGDLNSAYDLDIEPGFVLITRFIHTIFPSYTIWFVIIASWMWYSIFKLYTLSTNYNKIAANLLTVLIVANTFVTLMVPMRQATAICVFLTGFNLVLKESLNESTWELLIRRKKTIIGSLMILSTIFIHKSMIILLPIIILSAIVKFKKNVLIVSVIVSCVISYFFSQNIAIFFNAFFVWFGDIGVDFINSNVMEIYSEGFGENVQKATTYIAWAMPAILNIYISDEKETKNTFFNIYIFSVCFFLLFSTTFLYERINTLLILLGFTRFFPTKATRNTKWRMIYISLIFLILIVAFNRYNNWPITDSCIPYKFFWE